MAGIQVPGEEAQTEADPYEQEGSRLGTENEVAEMQDRAQFLEEEDATGGPMSLQRLRLAAAQNDVLETPDADVLETPDTSGDVLELSEDDERNANLSGMFEESLQVNPEKLGAAHALSRRMGVPADIAEQNFVELDAAAKAKDFDPAAWAKADPVLAQLVQDHADLGPMIMAEPIGAFGKLVKSYFFFSDLAAKADAAHKAGGAKAVAKVTDAAIAAPAVGAPQWMQVDPSASGGFLDKTAAAYRQGAKQTEISDLGARLILSTLRDEDPGEIYSELGALKASTGPRFYNANPLEQFGIDAMSILPSLVEGGKGAAAGAAAGAVVGAIPAFATENPSLIGKGAAIGARIGASARSGVREAGSTMAELIDERTDDGKPIDPKVAAGASILYGIVAAGIEGVSFGVDLSAFGPLGDAVRAGTGTAFLKGLLKNARRRVAGGDPGG